MVEPSQAGTMLSQIVPTKKPLAHCQGFNLSDLYQELYQSLLYQIIPNTDLT